VRFVLIRGLSTEKNKGNLMFKIKTTSVFAAIPWWIMVMHLFLVPVVNASVKSNTAPKWPIVIKQVEFAQYWQSDKARVQANETSIVTLNSSVVLDFEVAAIKSHNNVTVLVELARQSGEVAEFPIEIRQGIRRTDQVALTADELQPIKTLSIDTQLPRRINLVISIAANVKPGNYSGVLKLLKNNRLRVSRNFAIKVLNITLAPIVQPVGIHPQKSIVDGADNQARCEHDYLQKLGMTVLSQPLPGADKEGPAEAFKEDLLRFAHNFPYSAADYSTVNRFKKRLGQIKQGYVNRLFNQFAAHTTPGPAFAVMGEMPLLKIEGLTDLSRLIADLRIATTMPDANDNALINVSDKMLMDSNFSISKQQISEFKQQGKNVWFFDMNRKRLAGGFYLWIAGAQGYMQRRGAELGSQFFYPTDQICPQVPTINAGLLSISQGIIDQQWLNWLTEKAEDSEEAKFLVRQLKLNIPGDWRDAQQLSTTQIHQWRKAITDLAERL
jgi:hypothetical protein